MKRPKGGERRMKCIECTASAEYIFIIGGTGGSVCHKHLVEGKKHQDKMLVELRKKVEKLDIKIKDSQ
jgi:hypothetical protein